MFDEQSHERNLQCRLDPQSIPPLLHRERNRERSFKLSRLVFPCLTHALLGERPLLGREAAALARCSPPTLDIPGPACCTGHHPSCPFTLSVPRLVNAVSCVHGSGGALGLPWVLEGDLPKGGAVVAGTAAAG